MNAKLEEDKCEVAYRIFVTESLKLIPQNSFLTSSYIDCVEPEEQDTRTGEEIAIDVIKRLNLKQKVGE